MSEEMRFDFIMADPPWRFNVRSRETGLKKSPDAHYQTMTIEEIQALRVADIAAPSSVLWLWATWPLLPEAMATMAAWGFTYKTGGAWHKRTRFGKSAFGAGYLLRSATEPYLIGTRGSVGPNGKLRTTRAIRNVIDDLAREHSRKPEAAYRAAEEWVPGARRIELFSRQQRPGWTVWGDEVEKFRPLK